ncbi:hypothetical protein EMGBS15_13980 [Filimonas sp.]|nr:hypothetical protein EMGBS15_13980 [Filimonas sp.]
MASGWFDLGPNYTISYTKHVTQGVSLRAVGEFPFSQLAGLQVALTGTFTSYAQYAGVEVSTNLGYMRERLKDRKRK